MSLENDLQADPKGFANRYSMLPANAADGYVPSNENQWTTGQYEGFRHTVVDLRQGIARVSLEERLTDRGQAVVVKPSLTASTGLPVYFLPWDNRGAAVELTIPNRDPALPEAQHPKVFFTAVLSGCTIMFKGTAQNPTIFHCGTAGETGGQLATHGESNQFFRDMLERANMFGVGTTGQIQTQVKSTDYMHSTRNPSAHVGGLEQNVKKTMEQRYRGRMKVEDVSAWGIVFGVRNGRDWKFYLQENATIYYRTIDDFIETHKKKYLGGLITRRKEVKVRRVNMDRSHAIAKPIELKRIFPGTGVAKVTSTWRMVQAS